MRFTCIFRKLGPRLLQGYPRLNGATYPPKLILALPGQSVQVLVTLGCKVSLIQSGVLCDEPVSSWAVQPIGGGFLRWQDKDRQS